MSLPGIFKKNVINKSKFQDIIFISGILLFSAALVLGLFPQADIQEGSEREYFIYLMMTIPIIAAIYFIFISFSRKIYSGAFDFSSSIIFKMMLAFISVAILPALTIIIISNHIINETVANLITDETVYALEESINLSNDYVNSFYKEIDGELKALDYSFQKGEINPENREHRKQIIKRCEFIGLDCIFFRMYKRDDLFNDMKILNHGQEYNIYKELTSYLNNTDMNSVNRISNISINNNSILLGQLFYKEYIIALVKIIPEIVYNRLAVYNDSLKRYNKREFLRPYFETGVGILLLFIAILIIVISISVSFFLSRGITKPVLELADAAGHVASGDFRILLKRDSSDELALLFKSFNTMVQQLDESRKLMYHMQRLEAWKEVARRLVHEIKNPLTPIRLSAERIQNRFKENHPDINNIIFTGTETIIEEVKVLNRILNEFAGFARLPEMKVDYIDINPIIENCVNFFLGHESISFHLDLDDSIPRLYIDKYLIRQALTNLLQNSIDALIDKGNIYIKSKISNAQHQRIVRIFIRDDGPGIEAEDIEKIFDPAFSKKETGTGLGLAIVEKIVLEHKGKIYCYSNKGEGAEFVIEFPIIDEEAADGKNINS